MRIQRTLAATALVLATAIAPSSRAMADDPPEVTIQNYVRAETDLQMRNYVENMDAFGRFAHLREATDVASRDTIRPNRDTLYSWSVFDVTSRLTIGLPDSGGRYQSLMIVSQDHSIWSEYGPQEVVLDKETVGTRYALLLLRTFFDPNDEEDVQAAHTLQDAVTVQQADKGTAGGEVKRFFHLREPTPLDQQTVIRMNRDTIYSSAVVDISEGATLIVPDAGDRYMSVMVVNEDHYVNKVIHQPGAHALTVEELRTPYVALAVRTLVDASDPADIREANALQDKLKIEAASATPYSHPDYDQESYETTYEALLVLSRANIDDSSTFGRKEDVDPVRHLLGTAWGWGGLPEEEASYLTVNPNLPVGAYQLTFRDVPVDSFWSVTVYNKDGFFDPNDQDAYSVNSLTATANDDGSYTIHFGGDPESVNHLPIAEGWNYSVRFDQTTWKHGS